MSSGIGTECVNCRRESHFYGVCWWGVILLAPLYAVLLSFGVLLLLTWLL